MALPPSPILTPINESIVSKVNGRMIKFEENITEIDSLVFNFYSKQNGTVTYYRNQSREKYGFVISTNTYVLNMDPTLQLPVALQVKSENGNELVLHYNQLCRINNFYFHFTINDNSITTTMEETSNFIKMNIVSSFK